MRTLWIDLVLDTGELVRIECPAKFEDQLHDSIWHAMKRRDCTAEFMGLSMDRVNMARVVGTL